MSQLFVDNIKNRTGGAVGFPTGVVVTGVATFNNQVSIAGTLTYEDVTNVDSSGIVTAKSGIKVTGGEILVGSGFSVGQAGIVTASGGSFTGDVDITDKIVHTGDTNTAIRFPAADTFTVETSGSEQFRIGSDGLLTGKGAQFNSNITPTSGNGVEIFAPTSTSGQIQAFDRTNSARSDFIIKGNTISLHAGGSEAVGITSAGVVKVGSNTLVTPDANADNLVIDTGDVDSGISILSATTGRIYFGDAADDEAGSIRYVHSDNSMRFETDSTERLRITSTGGVHFSNAELIERVSIVANKLSAVPNVSLDNGMVHYYTTNETTTATPNIISTAGINTSMATGDTMSVTIMSKPNNAGYFPKVSIDGVATGITTYWSGGEAPSSAESSGVDVNVYQIIKTADATYDVLANTSNFA